MKRLLLIALLCVGCREESLQDNSPAIPQDIADSIGYSCLLKAVDYEVSRLEDSIANRYTDSFYHRSQRDLYIDSFVYWLSIND